MEGTIEIDIETENCCFIWTNKVALAVIFTAKASPVYPASFLT